MRLGVHVSIEGGISEAVERAHRLGCNTMQIFLRNPQRWRESRLSSEDIEAFNLKRTAYQIAPLFIHIPYLINLASPNQRLYRASIAAYIEDIKEAELLHAEYIVTHMGSHKGTTEEEGLQRFISALNVIIAKTQETSVGILLENTAGSGSWLGYSFRHHKVILDGLKERRRVGVCLDTAHAFLAGYDISSTDGLEGLLNELDSLIGLRTLQAIHLNDTKAKLGSHRDRHEHIGKGNIGSEGIKRIVSHPKLRSVPLILETPKNTPEADQQNLQRVRALRKRGEKLCAIKS